MNDFLCPKCTEYLRVGENIIFKIKNSRNQSCLLLLSPQIGNYTSHKHPSFEVKTGESLEFFCPLMQYIPYIGFRQKPCMRSAYQMNRVSSTMYTFHRIVGEHSTFQTNDDMLCMLKEKMQADIHISK